MPFNLLPAPKRTQLFWLFFALTVTFFAVFNGLDQPVRTPVAPAGIVSFELARTPQAASAMLVSWDEPARLSLAFGLGLDFLFMPVYAIALSLAVSLAAERRQGAVWSALGKFLAWGAFFAAIFDALENVFLFSILLNNAFTIEPFLAFCFASLKFLLLMAGFVYALLGWIFKQ